jgi:hypothetical protein
VNWRCAVRGVRLQFLQFAEQPVVFGIRDFRRVQHVIAPGVMMQLRSKLGSALCMRRLRLLLRLLRLLLHIRPV